MQIGPKIRVGGTLGKIGEGIKKVAPFAAPFLLPGVGGLATGVLSAIPHGADIANAVKGVGGALKGAVGGLPGASSIEDYLKGAAGKIPGMLGDALSHPLETAGVVSSALDQAKARGLQTEAINAARAGYDSRAGLRTKGVAGLMNPTAPDVSGVDYGSSGSVYGRRKIAGVS